MTLVKQNTRRFIEIIISLSILFISLPFFIISLVIVYFETRQSPLILQVRQITLEKKKIKLYKIRTIRENKFFSELEKKSGKVFYKQEYENFVPSFCRLLRRTGFDELPQLFNVIKGEMSLIGPRPLLENDLFILKEKTSEVYNRRGKITSLPGITGCWQIWGDRSKGANDLIYYDELYEIKKSPFFDLKIMINTARVVFTAKHSDAIIQNISLKSVQKELFESYNPYQV